MIYIKSVSQYLVLKVPCKIRWDVSGSICCLIRGPDKTIHDFKIAVFYTPMRMAESQCAYHTQCWGGCGAAGIYHWWECTVGPHEIPTSRSHALEGIWVIS